MGSFSVFQVKLTTIRTCSPHTMEASYRPSLLLNVKQGSAEPGNTNFGSLWLDLTRNRTRVYRFSIADVLSTRLKLLITFTCAREI